MYCLSYQPINKNSFRIIKEFLSANTSHSLDQSFLTFALKETNEELLLYLLNHPQCEIPKYFDWVYKSIKTEKQLALGRKILSHPRVLETKYDDGFRLMDFDLGQTPAMGIKFAQEILNFDFSRFSIGNLDLWNFEIFKFMEMENALKGLGPESIYCLYFLKKSITEDDVRFFEIVIKKFNINLSSEIDFPSTKTLPRAF